MHVIMYVEVNGVARLVDRAIVYFSDKVYKLKLELVGITPYTVTYPVNNWMEHEDNNLGIYYSFNMASIEVVL